MKLMMLICYSFVIIIFPVFLKVKQNIFTIYILQCTSIYFILIDVINNRFTDCFGFSRKSPVPYITDFRYLEILCICSSTFFPFLCKSFSKPDKSFL